MSDLQLQRAYVGLVKKIEYSVKKFPHYRADYKNKHLHKLTVEIDQKVVALLVGSNFEDNAGCNQADTISFRVANYHEGKNDYFVHILPPNVTAADINNITNTDGSHDISGTLAERSLAFAVAFTQYDTDRSVNDLFALSDMMLGYLGNRMKMKGF